jgi:protein required for attachment to host cells
VVIDAPRSLDWFATPGRTIVKNHWIVLANAARARILDREHDASPLQELADLVHPQSREKLRDLASDREGHAEKAHGDASHAGTAFQPRTEPHRKEHAIFASELSHYLEDAIAQGRCQALVLIASDPFLGELKAHLGPAAARIVSAAIPLDLTSYAGADLARRISDAISAARK